MPTDPPSGHFPDTPKPPPPIFTAPPYPSPVSDSHICAESGRGCLLLPMHHTHARARSPRHRQRQSLRLSLSQSHKQKTRKPMAVPPHPLHTPTLDTTPQSPTVTHPSPRPLPHSLAPHRCPLDGVTSSVAWGFEARWSQLITPCPLAIVPVTRQVWIPSQSPSPGLHPGRWAPITADDPPVSWHKQSSRKLAWFECWLVMPPPPPQQAVGEDSPAGSRAGHTSWPVG